MTESNAPQRIQAGFRPNRWLIVGSAIVLALGCLILSLRYQAVDKDHASANLNTVIGSLAIWLVIVACLFLSGRRKLSAMMGILPVLGVLGLMSFLRLERVDGELRPHFAWRWSAQPDLPGAAEGDHVELTTLPDVALFQSQSTDWPQFLGPDRNANIRSCAIERDWKQDPPKILWRQAIGAGWSGFAVRGQAAITMEQRDQQEWVSAYHLTSGSLLWRYLINSRHYDPLGGVGPRSTPAIAEDRVFACSAVSDLVCLHLPTGRELWRKDLNQIAQVDQAELLQEVKYGRSGSPLVDGSSVIIPLGGSSNKADSLIAFDVNSGEELWRSGDAQISFASPMLVTLLGVEQILYPTKIDLLSCDPKTGQPLWRFRYEGSEEAPNVAQPIPLDDKTLFVSKGYGVGARLVEIQNSTAGTEVNWNAKLIKENRTVMRTKFTNPVYFRDSIYGLSDGIMECIEARTLKRQWKGGRYRHGQMLLLNDSLLVSTEEGRIVLVALDSSEHRELGEISVINDVTWNPPTLVGEHLLVRNSKEVACIRLTKKASQP